MKKKHEKELQTLEITQRLILNVYYDTTVYVGGNNPGTASLTLAFLDTPKQR